MKTELTTYIPINLPPVDSLVEGSGLKTDKIKVFLNQCFLSKNQQSGYSGNWKPSSKDYIYKDGYCGLQAAILRSLLGARYRDYVALLLKKGVIVSRPSPSSIEAYSPGKMCRHYKISPKLLHSNTSPRHFRKETITDKTTIKAVLRTQERFSVERRNRSGPLLDIHHRLISMEKAVRFRTTEAEHLFETSEGVDLPENPQRMQLELLHSINDGEFPTKVDLFGERLYSPLKRVSKRLRPYLYFEGFEMEQLVELDIRNSQLYFSTLITNSDIISQIAPEFNPVIGAVAEYGQKEDFLQYSELCQNGTIYDYWTNIREHESRDNAKKEFFLILFGKVASKHPGVRAFKNHFPSVAGAFRRIKELNEDVLPFIKTTYLDFTGKRKVDHNHANLSCLTQRLESRIFIRLIGADLLEKNIQPFFTIHDSIFIPARYENEVRLTIEQRFKLLNVAPPTIKTSPIPRN